jgi:hypothetical protein
LEFGSKGSNKWIKNATFASVCTDYRVIMQDPKRFNSKIAEMFESLDRHLKDVKQDENYDGLIHMMRSKKEH